MISLVISNVTSDEHGKPWLVASRETAFAQLASGSVPLFMMEEDVDDFHGGDRPIVAVNGSHNTAADTVRARISYLDAVRQTGGVPVMLPVGLDQRQVEYLFADADAGPIKALVMQGGYDLPLWFCADGFRRHASVAQEPLTSDLQLRTDCLLLETALDSRIQLPIIGVCVAGQTLNRLRGGSLHGHLPDALTVGGSLHNAWQRRGIQLAPETAEFHGSGQMRGGAPNLHLVQAMPGTVFERIYGSAPVLQPSNHHMAVDDLGWGLIPGAYCPITGVLEGFSVAGHPFAVFAQFHPEIARPDFGWDYNEHLFTALIEHAVYRSAALARHAA